MLISKLRLKNGYKRFHDLTIDLGANPARIVALVGPNGCGKSSVLDGILFHVSAHSRIGTPAHRDASYHSMTGAAEPNWEDIEIQFTTGSFPAIYQKRAASGTHRTIFSFRSPYRYNSNVRIKGTEVV